MQVIITSHDADVHALDCDTSCSSCGAGKEKSVRGEQLTAADSEKLKLYSEEALAKLQKIC